jgi:hypothetical protein
VCGSGYRPLWQPEMQKLPNTSIRCLPQDFPLKGLQRSRVHEFHHSGIRMDTEAVEADGACPIVGRKLGPAEEATRRFNEMMESDWAGGVSPTLQTQKPR